MSTGRETGREGRGEGDPHQEAFGEGLEDGRDLATSVSLEAEPDSLGRRHLSMTSLFKFQSGNYGTTRSQVIRVIV